MNPRQLVVDERCDRSLSAGGDRVTVPEERNLEVELEVKMLHISGLRVRPGDRVVAGATLIAKRATKFPFGSQVDVFTKAPAWPHVHMEVTKIEVPSATPVAEPSTLAFSRCG